MASLRLELVGVRSHAAARSNVSYCTYNLLIRRHITSGSCC